MMPDNRAARQTFWTKAVMINARSAAVWHRLTTIECMQHWMLPDSDLAIITDWTVGHPLVVRGTMNGHPFENWGTVLRVEPERSLQYSHLSSTSRLPDRPESYSIVAFTLEPLEDQTLLAVKLTQFPTESIYKHLAFYWNSALEVFKRYVDNGG
jgi:uncharacterized protein YndB with AHSA1/START domain